MRRLPWTPSSCILTGFNEAYVFSQEATLETEKKKCLSSPPVAAVDSSSSRWNEIAVRSVRRVTDKLIKFVKYVN